MPLLEIRDEVVVGANRAARSLLGDDVVGARLADRVVGADRARVAQLVRSAVGGLQTAVFGGSGVVVRCELRLRAAPDGRRLVSLREEEDAAPVDPWDELPEPVLALAPTSLEVVRANLAAVQLLGRPPGGWSLPEAFPDARREALRHALQTGIERTEPFLLEWTGAGGVQIPVEVVASSSRGLFLLCARDLRHRHGDQRERAPERAPAEPAPIDALRVLVVDDDPQVRSALRRLLRKMSAVVEEAGTGAEALRALESRAFDVVLCDLHLQAESGAEACKAFRRRHPTLRLVLMTGGAVNPSVRAAADGVLQKPFTLETLRDALDDGALRSTG